MQVRRDAAASPPSLRRPVIVVLRASDISSMLDHANLIEGQLETHGPGESEVTPSLTDDVFHRSSNWARGQLGIPLPPD